MLLGETAISNQRWLFQQMSTVISNETKSEIRIVQGVRSQPDVITTYHAAHPALPSHIRVAER
mgnify:CR=1 FL=1